MLKFKGRARAMKTSSNKIQRRDENQQQQCQRANVKTRSNRPERARSVKTSGVRERERPKIDRTAPCKREHSAMQNAKRFKKKMRLTVDVQPRAAVSLPIQLRESVVQIAPAPLFNKDKDRKIPLINHSLITTILS
jgi:hypothetical protein